MSIGATHVNGAAFIAVVQTAYGSAVYVPGPKLEAYKYAAMLQAQGNTTYMEFREDGTVSVFCAGLETMTFIPERSN
jgi:hypothetical protein